VVDLQRRFLRTFDARSREEDADRRYSQRLDKIRALEEQQDRERELRRKMLEGKEPASIKGFLGSKFREAGKSSKIKSIETFNRDAAADVAKSIVKPSPETKRKIASGARKVAKGYGRFADSYLEGFEEFPGFEIGYGESNGGKKKGRSDPTGSGLDMDAYLNSFVPQSSRPSKKQRTKQSDLYDPFAGLDVNAYVGGGSSKSKRRSKDPIGQFFY
jgi:hypothetical protein